MASVEAAPPSNVPTLKTLCLEAMAESTLDKRDEQTQLERMVTELNSVTLIAEFMMERDRVRQRMEAHKALDALTAIENAVFDTEIHGECECGRYLDDIEVDDCTFDVRYQIRAEQGDYEEWLRRDEEYETNKRRRLN